MRLIASAIVILAVAVFVVGWRATKSHTNYVQRSDCPQGEVLAFGVCVTP